MANSKKDDKFSGEVVRTTLVQNKTCKSCVRYGSKNAEDKVTTSIYLQNESFEALGKPEKIEVAVSAKKS